MASRAVAVKPAAALASRFFLDTVAF